LELPADPSKGDPQQFDYDTISDVILHIRYTAREGGALLRNGAVANLRTCMDEAEAAGSVRLFSIRHEFPAEWAKFKSVRLEGEIEVARLTLNLRIEHYPFWSQGRLGAVKQVELFAKTPESVDIFELVDEAGQPDPTGIHDTLDGELGDLRVGKLTIVPAAPIGEYTLYLDNNSMEELWLVVTWGKAV
jgi:hypothetical protein